MMQYFPTAYPPWYVEGFAEFYSTADIDAKGTASVGKPAYHRAYGLVYATPFPINRLLADKPRAKGGEQLDAYYARAWLLTHMLSFSDTRKGQLPAYLKAFANGTPALKAAEDAFGPLPALDKALNAYLDVSRWKYRQLSGLDMKVSKVTIEALDPAQDALFIERLNLLTDIEDGDRPRFLANVRREAARYPDNPYAIDMLVEAYLLEGDTAASNTLNDRLLALKPDYAPALLRKAGVMADKVGEADDQAAQWKTIRALIVKANRINQDDPVALFRYYQAFKREGVAPPKVAVDGLLRVYDLAPQLGEVRITLAQQLIDDKRIREARAVLMPLAYAPHGGEGSEAARAMIATIDGEKPSPEKQAE